VTRFSEGAAAGSSPGRELKMSKEDDQWWACPSCGEETQINNDPRPDEPDRHCAACDWEVRIPRFSETQQ
jgi:predicted RNA-binding Zn-ribbon protein involved in translation (DUF1610 family)